MDENYLIFGYRGALYGLRAGAVSEIVWLPALSPIEELPPHIVGVFNLRGQVVPVMDLGLRFGHPSETYLNSDRVIVIDNDAVKVGIIANELHDVLTLPQSAIENAENYQGAGGHAQFVFGEAKLEDGLAMMLDIDALLHATPTGETLSAQMASPAENLSRIFGTLAPEEAEVFRSRAHGMAQEQGTGDSSGLQGHAVIRLENELFGLGLDVVREFAHLRNVAPLPCCPPHILGNMNLRGDILTLLDIRFALGMTSAGAVNEVVVVQVGKHLLGLPAAEIVDVVHLAPSDITAVPVASERAGKDFCKGVATVGDQVVGILDLEKILAARELHVAEQV